MGERRRGRTARIAAIAAALVVGAGTWWAVGAGDEHPGTAGCISQVTVDGRTYTPNGDLTRTPRPGLPLGRIRIDEAPCEGTDEDVPPARHVQTYRLAGLAPSAGFLAEGAVCLNTRLPALPVVLHHLYTPVRCRGEAPRSLSGHLIGSTARVRVDHHVHPPYIATFVIDRGAGLELDTYTEETIRVRVTTDTENAADPDLMRRTLGGGHRAAVDAVCDGGRFLATGIRLG